MATNYLQKLILILSLVLPLSLTAKDYIIYTISQDIPMGEPNEIVKKNYYVNIGRQQGITKGATLDVYRKISRLDPYESKTRYDYNVKIGELSVIHSEDTTAIASYKKLNSNDPESPYFEIKNFMIGDKVNVSVK